MNKHTTTTTTTTIASTTATASATALQVRLLLRRRRRRCRRRLRQFNHKFGNFGVDGSQGSPYFPTYLRALLALLRFFRCRWSSMTSALMARRMSEGQGRQKREYRTGTRTHPHRPIVALRPPQRGRKLPAELVPSCQHGLSWGKRLMRAGACGYQQNASSCNATDSLSGIKRAACC